MKEGEKDRLKTKDGQKADAKSLLEEFASAVSEGEDFMFDDDRDERIIGGDPVTWQISLINCYCQWQKLHKILDLDLNLLNKEKEISKLLCERIIAVILFCYCYF